MAVNEAVQDIEDAIQLLVKSDCVTNCRAINTLEETSYRLWVESNTAFLDESFLSTCTEEDHCSWFWDDECFYISTHDKDDHFPFNNIQEDDPDDICSSINTSISPCNESTCSIGYHGDAESSMLSTDSDLTDMEMDCEVNPSLYTGPASTHSHICLCSSKTSNLQLDKSCRYEICEEHRIFADKKETTENVYSAEIHLTSEEVNNTDEVDDGWVVVEKENQTFDVSDLSKTVSANMTSQQKVVHKTDADGDWNETGDEEDWTILSLKITEINSTYYSNTVKHLKDVVSNYDTSRDSGMMSHEASNSWNKSHVSTNYRRHLIPQPYR